MTATIEEIHQDPRILDRAIESREQLEILSGGQVKATLVPKVQCTIEEARQWMEKKFISLDWEFSNTPMTRDERNARG